MRIVSLAFVLCVVGCGGNSGSTNDGGNNGGTGGNGGVVADLASARAVDLARAGGVSITVAVPASWKGTPRQLVVAAFDHVPVTGPPAGILYQATPSISAGQTITLTGDASGISGDKQVVAVLYMQGGGMFAPMPGVDYVSAPVHVTFGAATLAVGPLTLMLDSADGGF